MKSSGGSHGHGTAAGKLLRFEKSIGRVGALAVALGVGVGLGTPLACGIAQASGPDSTSSSSDQASGAATKGPRSSSTGTSGRSAPGPRRDAKVSLSGVAAHGSPSASVPASTPEVGGHLPTGRSERDDTRAPSVPADSAVETAQSVPSPATVASARVVVADKPMVAAAITRPVTLRSIVTDTLTWLGLARLARLVPVPDVPLPSFVESLWLGVRGVQRSLNNQRPAAQPTLAGQDPDGTIRGALNATDFEGDPLTYAVSGQAGSGSASVDSSGNFVYTPNQQQAATGGDDSFTIAIDDGAAHGLFGLTGVKTVTINVTVTAVQVPVNHAPTAGVTAVGSPGADGKVTGTVHASDSDGDALSYSGSGPTPHGTVVVNIDGSFAYTPTAEARHNAAANGANTGVTTDGFTVTVSDGEGGTLAVPVSVPVSPINTDPSGVTVNAGTPNAASGVVTGSVHATDADHDTLKYTVTQKSSLVQQLTLDSSTGAFTYTPTATARQNAGSGGVTSDIFTVTIADGHGGSTTADVTVTIAPPVNHAPVAGTDTVTTAEDTVKVIAVLSNDSDPDGDSVTIVEVANPAHGSATYSGGSVTYTPAANYTGADTFTYTITDGRGEKVTGTVNVTVSPINDAPVAGNPAFTTSTDPDTGVVTGHVNVTDPDGGAVIYELAAPVDPAIGTVELNSSTGAFTFTPTPQARENASQTTEVDTVNFTVVALDFYGGSVSTPVSAAIVPAAGNSGGFPIGPRISGVNGYAYQFLEVTHGQIEVAKFDTAIQIFAPNGSTAVTAVVEGLAYIGDPTSHNARPFTYMPVPRADGSIVFATVDEEGVLRLVSATPDGTTTIVHTTNVTGLSARPLYAPDGTAYLIEPMRLERGPQWFPSFKVLRLDTNGELSGHTYEPAVLSEIAVPLESAPGPVGAVGPNGTLYVAFEVFAGYDPHAGMMAVPTTGEGHAYTVTRISDSGVVDPSSVVSVEVSEDGTAYLTAKKSRIAEDGSSMEITVILAVSPDGTEYQYVVEG
ncbi:outer membrane adhesin like protein [Mycolicibacterium rhodesiae JS60]|nr:outer membrane adhesin like protein [Mycolicibacterium rhodesiae JS60]